MRNSIWGKIALGAMLLAALTPARANIGDTLNALRQRYGSAKDMGAQMLFEVRIKDGRIIPARGAADSDDLFSVTVYFDGPYSAMEIFTRNTSNPAKADITDDDIKAVLAVMGGDVPWARVETGSSKPTWVWGDEKDKPPKIMARLEPARSASPDDAPVLVVMKYTEK